MTTLHTIAKNVQTRLKFNPGRGLKTKDVKEAITWGACTGAETLDAKAIIAFSKTGKLLSLVTKWRPNVDIFVFTDSEEIRKKLMIYWNTFSFKIKFNDDFELMTKNALKILKDGKLLVKKDRVVIVSDINQRKDVEILEIREID